MVRLLCLELDPTAIFRITDELSAKGYYILALNWMVVLILAGSCLKTVLWTCIFVGDNCDELFVSIHIEKYGACFVGSFNEDGTHNCIYWSDRSRWREVDAQSGSYTGEVGLLFPLIRWTCIGLICLACLSIVLSIVAPSLPRIKLEIQYAVFITGCISSIGFLSIFISAPASDALHYETWEYLSDCTEKTSFPVQGWYSAVCAFVLSTILALNAVFPARSCCLKFVEHGDVADLEQDPNGTHMGGSERASGRLDELNLTIEYDNPMANHDIAIVHKSSSPS